MVVAPFSLSLSIDQNLGFKPQAQCICMQMSPGLYLQSLPNEEKFYELFYACPLDLPLPLPLPPTPLPCKRLKTSETTKTSPNRIQFREYIHKYKQNLEAAVADNDDDDSSDSSDSHHHGMRLVQMLISCAEAVACRDSARAKVLLAELKASALALGSSFHRVASCFVQGLAERLALVQPLGTVGLVSSTAVKRCDAKRSSEALELAYEVCPYIQFGHFVANASILEAFEGENLVHVVDLGMTLGLPHGHQWQSLLRGLADRDSGPPRRVRVTGVSPHADRLDSIGSELESYALSLGINFEFFGITASLENLKPEHFAVDDGEVLAISSILQLHCVVKESRGALNSVLQVIHGLSPRVLVVVEQDSSHNGPFFLGRFMEALHYYSAIFDSLDALLPRYDTRRAKVEQFYYGEEIKNIVSCEGPGRLERHERVDQWRRRMSRAGFQPSPVKMASRAREFVGEMTECEGFTVAEEKGCVVLGWKGKPVVAASCWKC